MVGIDRRLLQNVDWPLLGATVGLVILSASTLASLHVGRAGGSVAVRQLAWFGVGMVALVVVAGGSCGWLPCSTWSDSARWWRCF